MTLRYISVINQLDAHNFCFTIILFHASTCFEHHVLIIKRSKLHYTASGVITHTGGCLVHRCKICASSGLITEIYIVRCRSVKCQNFSTRFGVRRSHPQGFSYLNVRFSTQQLTVSICPDVLLQGGLLTGALYSRFHEGHS